MAQIDFVPATIAAVEERGQTTVLVFPSQPLISRELGADDVVPFHRVELIVAGGRTTHEQLLLPLAIENLFVDFSGGGRASFLPVGFEASGRVKVRVELENGGRFEKRALIEGGAFISLRVLERVQ